MFVVRSTTRAQSARVPSASNGCERPVLGQVLDHRGAVRPVGLGDRGEGGPRVVAHRRQVGIGAGGARGHERERRHALGVVQGQELGERAAHRLPDDVRPAHAQDGEQGRGVGHEVVARVPGLPRRVARRAARVAVVVPDHVTRPGREACAEVVLPPVHRGARPHDEQDRRVGRAAERLNAEIDAVDLH
jgi:hypothetical protein